MWSRQELKSNARIMLKANYLKIVIVSVVFALLTRLVLCQDLVQVKMKKFSPF